MEKLPQFPFDQQPNVVKYFPATNQHCHVSCFCFSLCIFRGKRRRLSRFVFVLFFFSSSFSSLRQIRIVSVRCSVESLHEKKASSVHLFKSLFSCWHVLSWHFFLCLPRSVPELIESTSLSKPEGRHYGTKPGHFETSKIHFPTSEGVSKVNEQANEWAVRVNERTDERVTQYLRLYSCLFQTTV